MTGCGSELVHQIQRKLFPPSFMFFIFSVEFHSRKGFSSEVDIFITQTVLQYLCLKKHIVAALGTGNKTNSAATAVISISTLLQYRYRYMFFFTGTGTAVLLLCYGKTEESINLAVRYGLMYRYRYFTIVSIRREQQWMSHMVGTITVLLGRTDQSQSGLC